MATLGEFIPSSNTKVLLHLNGSSADSSGNNNNGVDTAITYSQANGKFGQGAGFNGVSSVITFADSASLKPTGNFTISCWYKGTAVADYETIFQSGYRTPSIYSGIELSIQPTTNFAYVTSNKNSGTVAGTDLQYAITATSVKGNVWNNIIGVWDGSYLRMYLNGVANGSPVAWTYAPVYPATNYVRLGSLNNNGTIYGWLSGAIDEPFLDAFAWTPQQVAKYYANAKGRWAAL